MYGLQAGGMQFTGMLSFITHRTHTYPVAGCSHGMCLQQLKQYQLKVSRGIAVRFQEEGSSSESSAANLGLSYLLF